MKTKFEKIYIDSRVAELPRTLQILNRLPGVPNFIVEHNPATFDQIYKDTKDPYAQSKKAIYITQHNGPFLQNCPGMSSKYRCCNYLTIDVAMNCDLECTYCVLQSFFKTSVLTIHVNLDDLFHQLNIFLAEHPLQNFRAGTGEYTDSLTLDHITEFSRELIPFFAQKSNIALELKTKTNNIQNLENLKHNRRTIISWSLNGTDASRKEEFKTSTIEERILAAKQCQAWGYPIAFHFDPMLYFPNWKEDYNRTFELLKKHIHGDIAWISIGSLRLNQGLKNTIQNRFSKNSLLLDGELFPEYDGKLRYLRPVRIQMYRFMQEKIKETWSDKIPYYLCMEPPEVWQDSFGWTPNSDNNLDHILQSKLF